MKPRITIIAGLAAAALALSPGVAGAAAAGDLDPTFGAGGKQAFPFAGVPNAALVQPDGKIVLAGMDANLDFAVWRLNPDGALDRSFDGDGAVAIGFGGQDEIKAAALQPDGKIVVAGTIHSPPALTSTARLGYDIAIARLNPNGSLDRTFNPEGRDGGGTKVFATEEDAWATAVAVQPYDGAIVLAGYTTGATTFSLRRLDSTGAVDGTVFENPPGTRDEYVWDVVMQPDGSIVVAGQAAQLMDSRQQAMVARYTPQGSLDETFAGTGIKLFPEVRPDEVLVRPDGTLVVAGSDYDDLHQWMTVTQLTGAGQIYKAFGDGGTARVDFAGDAESSAAVLQRDGKLVAVGALTPASAFAVARLDASGALDAGFGAAGKATTAFGEFNLSTATALQPDGRIVVAGVTATNNVVQLAVARLLGEATTPAGGSQGPGTTTRSPRCAGRRATIVGTARRDTLRGTRRADVIVALGGNDTVLARGGNDVVCGGAGNDRLSGGPGRDLLTGGAGRDRCIGAAGRDRAAGCERRRSL